MTSICVFGSHARNSLDELSDKDILVVDDAEAIHSKEYKHWERRGWNVTHFEKGRFQRMADVNALFVQHIKLEGRTFRDDGGFLKAVLEGYSPALCYAGELSDAIHQLEELPISGCSYWADLCIADTAYVLFRNVVIFFLANQGCYEFSYPNLVEIAGQQLHWTDAQKDSLRRLRELKFAYRHRDTGAEVGNSIEVAKVLSQTMAPLDHKVQSSIRAGRTTDDYFRLRLVEIGLVGVEDPRHLDGRQPSDASYQIWQTIMRAGGYPKPKGLASKTVGHTNAKGHAGQLFASTEA